MTLSDTALMMLSAAARRDDYAVEPPAKLKGAAGDRLIAKLQRDGLIVEVAPHGAMPIWRRDEEGLAIGLRVTAAGLAAIGVDEGRPEFKHDDGQTAATTRKRKGGSAGSSLPVSKRHAAKERPQTERHRDHASRNRRTPAGAFQPASAQQAVSKQAQVVGMLSRQHGATIPDIMIATGWQPHSVRGFLAGSVRKRLGLTLISEVVGEERRYRIPGTVKAGSPAKARKRTVG